jgi:excisionase family DNA binding protein
LTVIESAVMKKKNPNLMTPPQAAEAIGVPAKKVREWCENGDLPSYRKYSGRWMIDRMELIEFVERNNILPSGNTEVKSREF